MKSKIRIPCSTIFPEVETHYADGRVEKLVNVICGGQLFPCDICLEPTWCSYESRCLNGDAPWHIAKRKYSIDDEVFYFGYTRGERWNGWACPRFEFDEAMRVAKAFKGTYDQAQDAFVFQLEGMSDDEADIVKGEDLVTDKGTKHVYAIGAWSWVWDEVGE